MLHFDEDQEFLIDPNTYSSRFITRNTSLPSNSSVKPQKGEYIKLSSLKSMAANSRPFPMNNDLEPAYLDVPKNSNGTNGSYGSNTLLETSAELPNSQLPPKSENLPSRDYRDMEDENSSSGKSDQIENLHIHLRSSSSRQTNELDSAKSFPMPTFGDVKESEDDYLANNQLSQRINIMIPSTKRGDLSSSSRGGYTSGRNYSVATPVGVQEVAFKEEMTEECQRELEMIMMEYTQKIQAKLYEKDQSNKARSISQENLKAILKKQASQIMKIKDIYEGAFSPISPIQKNHASPSRIENSFSNKVVIKPLVIEQEPQPKHPKKELNKSMSHSKLQQSRSSLPMNEMRMSGNKNLLDQILNASPNKNSAKKSATPTPTPILKKTSSIINKDKDMGYSFEKDEGSIQQLQPASTSRKTTNQSVQKQRPRADKSLDFSGILSNKSAMLVQKYLDHSIVDRSFEDLKKKIEKKEDVKSSQAFQNFWTTKLAKQSSSKNSTPRKLSPNNSSHNISQNTSFTGKNPHYTPEKKKFAGSETKRNTSLNQSKANLSDRKTSRAIDFSHWKDQQDSGLFNPRNENIEVVMKPEPMKKQKSLNNSISRYHVPVPERTGMRTARNSQDMTSFSQRSLLNSSIQTSRKKSIGGSSSKTPTTMTPVKNEKPAGFKVKGFHNPKDKSKNNSIVYKWDS